MRDYIYINDCIASIVEYCEYFDLINEIQENMNRYIFYSDIYVVTMTITQYLLI